MWIAKRLELVQIDFLFYIRWDLWNSPKPSGEKGATTTGKIIFLDYLLDSYLLFKEIICLPSYHKTVTPDCSVHKLKIICRISDLVFNILLLWAAYRYSCSMTSDLKGSCPSRNSLWNSSSAINFFIFASTTSGRFRQITKATVWISSSWSPITVQGPSSSCIYCGKLDVIYGWKCCVQLTSAWSSETEVSQLDGSLWHWSTPSALFGIFIHLYDYDFIPLIGSISHYPSYYMIHSS
jgi:hypothetical protein